MKRFAGVGAAVGTMAGPVDLARCSPLANYLRQARRTADEFLAVDLAAPQGSASPRAPGGRRHPDRDRSRAPDRIDLPRRCESGVPRAGRCVSDPVPVKVISMSSTQQRLATDELLRLQDVRKVYGRSRNAVAALAGVSLGFQRRTFTAVMGPSGSGKSTFLHCAALLDRPTSGSVLLEGRDLTAMNERALTKLRRNRIGFVFQSFNLLPALSVVDNVTLPLRLAGRRPDRGLVEEVIDRTGLASRRRHRPGELSGGQQQRVAIARALVTRPVLLFGDEPTGALDTQTALEILALLREAVDSGEQTAVVVTHDPVVASHADRVVFLVDGRVSAELERPSVQQVAEQMTRLGDRARTRRPVGAERVG
jgi:putative ABC transport system ATP-binding protein